MCDISIIIPVFNAEKTISSAIDSVLNQTCIDEYNIEIIIIDDGSTDSTVCMVKNIRDNRIRIISQSNAGVSSARNRGILAAKGEYIAFLDADDVWVRDKLEKQFMFLRRYQDVGLVSSGKLLIKEDQRTRQSYFKNDEYGDFSRRLFFGNFVTTSSVLVKKNVLQDALFDNNLKFGEDWVFWLSLSIKIPFGYIAEPLVEYKYSPISRYPIVEIKKCYKRIFKIFSHNFKDKSFEKDLKGNYLFSLATYYLQYGHIKKSNKYLKMAIKTTPFKYKKIIKYLLLRYQYGH